MHSNVVRLANFAPVSPQVLKAMDGDRKRKQ